MTRIEELEWKLDTLTKMHKNAKEDYESISNELNECQKALAELKESKKEGKWKPSKGEFYWLRYNDGMIKWTGWSGDEIDNWRYNNIPIFPTKEECERYWHFMDTVKEKSYEFSKEEWEDWDIYKHYIYYDYGDKDFYISSVDIGRGFGEIYFKDEESAQYIIDNFKDELMEYWI